MSKYKKATARIKSLPSDYTYAEAGSLLRHLGYEEINKGRTSGSRVKFYRASDQRIILLHKPHPGDIMDPGAVRQLVNFHQSNGDI